MKFKLKPLPQDGDTRIITTFCLFPRIVKRELFWLQKIKIKQRYTCGGHYMDESGWEDKEVI